MTTPPLYQPFYIDSADKLPRERAPQNYRPHWKDSPRLYDDQLEDAEAIPAWQRYFTNTWNHLDLVLIGHDRQLHFVAHNRIGFDYGPYKAFGPGYNETFKNAYDAFWTGETAAKTYTDPGHLTGEITETAGNQQEITAQFLIRGPVERDGELNDLLRIAGFAFDPRGDQLHLNQEHILDGVLTGRESEEFIRELNRYLKERGRPQRIRVSYDDMTTAERQSLLAFVNTSVVWALEFHFEVDEIAPEDLDTFIQKNPTLFTAREETEGQ